MRDFVPVTGCVWIMANFSAIDSACGVLRDEIALHRATLKRYAHRIGGHRLLIATVLAILAIVAIVASAASIRIGTAVALDTNAAEPSEPATVVNQLTALNDAAPTLRMKCPECGVVESRRELVPDESNDKDAAAQQRRATPVRTYEITLRMKDGRSHRFVDAYPAHWRPGERIILISGIDSESH